jgi:hypothetical protein
MIQRLKFNSVVRVIVLASVVFPKSAGAATLDESAKVQPFAGNQQTEVAAPSDPNASRTNSQSDEPQKNSSTSGETKCGPLDEAAVRHGVPPEFFRRLIRQESNFDPNSISRAGAMGIAQFMPGTAHWRGLADPFEPAQALDESARWLGELRDEFGNLGLAAAAYNAGPRRVKDWIAGRGQLPSETRAYVRIITGRSAQEWLSSASREIPPFEPPGACTPKARRATPKPLNRQLEASRGTAPWGLQLIGEASQVKALSEYAQLQKRFHSILGDRAPTIIEISLGGRGASTWFFVRVAESSRAKAMQLCSKLQSAGGSCLVIPNS